MEVDSASGGGGGDDGMDISAALNIKKEKRKFNAKLYGRTIQKGFAKLYKDAELSDVTLIVGDEKIPVHKMVLCAWSETFRAMLEVTSAWKESTQKELEVNIDESEHVHFKQILEYMYTGSTDFIEASNIVPLIALSNYYGIDALKEVCGKLLGDNISDDNLFFLLDIVEKYNCTELEKICGSFLATNFAQMWQDDETRLLTLRADTWAAMLASDELAVSSEQVLFEAVMGYASQYNDDSKRKDEVLTTLLPLVRYNFLPAEFLLSKLEQNEDIHHLPIVEKLLYETYRFRAYPQAKLRPSYSTRPRIGFQKWDTNEKGTGITLSNEGLTAQSTNGGWETVRGQIPISHGYPYFEVQIDQSVNIMLGVCVGNIATTSYAGQYGNGFTLHGADGNFYNGGNNTMQNMTFASGDKVGIYVDIDEGKLTFFKNGKKSFDYGGIEKGSDKIYPVVSFAGSNKVTLASRPEFPEELVGVVSVGAKKKIPRSIFGNKK